MDSIMQKFKQFGYVKQEIIGQGSFGILYKLTKDDDSQFCIKVEKNKSNNYSLYESFILSYINQQKAKYVIKYYQFTRYDEYQCTFMQYGGVPLSTLIQLQQKMITGKQWYTIAKQLIIGLQDIHQLGIIHKDLKPQNILFDIDKNMTYIIDFGLSQLIKKPNQQLIYDKHKKVSFVGTIMFCSLNSHQGRQQIYMDDMETLLYILIYIYTGMLPWSGIGIQNSEEDKYLAIKRSKQQLIENKNIELLVQNNNVGEFLNFLIQQLPIYTIKFQTPNYDDLLNKLQICKNK